MATTSLENINIMSGRSTDDTMQLVESLIRPIQDFPQKGILFRDIMPVFQNPTAVNGIIEVMTAYIDETYDKVDVIMALDARGFLFGPSIAINLGKPFVPVRKKGKLPGDCISVESTKEYGKDVLEIQADAIKPGQNVVIVDDLLATGGTMEAASRLTTTAKANVVGCICLVELKDLQGRAKLTAPFHSFIKY